MKPKNLLAVAAFVSLGSAALAQVVFTDVLDVVTADLGASCFASDYSPNEDIYLVSAGGSTVNIYNGTTGADTATDVDISGLDPAGLGVFGIACADDGRIFMFNNEEATAGATPKWWLFTNSSDTTPTEAVASGADFARFGHVEGAGTNTILIATGGPSDGPANIYTTADAATWTLADAAAVQAKSGLAVNSTVTTTWAVGDTGANNVQKFNGTIGGTWTEDTSPWPSTTDLDGSGPLVYDNANNVLFGVLMGGGPGSVIAIDADDATNLGSDALTNNPSTVTGYHGDHVVSTSGSGTLWASARGATASTAVLYKWTFTVAGSNVDDWSAY